MRNCGWIQKSEIYSKIMMLEKTLHILKNTWLYMLRPPSFILNTQQYSSNTNYKGSNAKSHSTRKAIFLRITELVLLKDAQLLHKANAEQWKCFLTSRLRIKKIDMSWLHRNKNFSYSMITKPEHFPVLIS